MATKHPRKSPAAKGTKGRVLNRTPDSPEHLPGSRPAEMTTGALPKSNRTKTSGKVSPAERYRMIAVAAYYRAERRGFALGGELDDWIAAEAEIAKLLVTNASRARPV